MIIMLVLVSMCVLCGGIGLLVGAGNQAADDGLSEQKRLQMFFVLGAMMCLWLACKPLGAQEVVHAAAGKLVSVNAAQKTLTLKRMDGTTMSFQVVASHEPALSLDKAVREKTVPVAGYSKVGSNVVVLYFGYDSPTAVAIKELGPDAPKKCTGSVSNFDRHEHRLTLKTDAAGAQNLVLTEDTIVDTNDGVVKLADYKPSKGERLRCFTGADSGTALFIAQQ
jgi:hypothetical protein